MTGALAELSQPRLRRKARGLLAFFDRRLRTRLGMRSGFIYAWGIAVSYAVFLFVADRQGSLELARSMLVKALATASWITGGLCALSLAAPLERNDEEEGIVSLVRERGFLVHELGVVRWLAGARRIAIAVMVPALVVGAVVALRVHSALTALGLLALLAGAGVYAVFLGAGLSALARLSTALAPRFGRSLLVALVLLPHAARQLWHQFPSVPALYATLLEVAAQFGSGV